MVVADSTAVYSAISSIEKELKFSFGGSEWVIIIYMLVFAGLALLGGRISDYYGRKRMFTIGVWIFSLSSALCGLSQTGDLLILARLFQ
jgi:MFS family permease